MEFDFSNMDDEEDHADDKINELIGDVLAYISEKSSYYSKLAKLSASNKKEINAGINIIVNAANNLSTIKKLYEDGHLTEKALEDECQKIKDNTFDVTFDQATKDAIAADFKSKADDIGAGGKSSTATPDDDPSNKPGPDKPVGGDEDDHDYSW